MLIGKEKHTNLIGTLKQTLLIGKMKATYLIGKISVYIESVTGWVLTTGIYDNSKYWKNDAIYKNNP